MAALGTHLLSFTLLADNRNTRLVVTSLCLVAALLVAAIVLAAVSRWRRRSATEDLSPTAQLAQFRSLYEAGQISTEEYERLKSLLNAQMREALPRPKPELPAPKRQPPDPPQQETPPA